jgi:riboflavin synthase
MFSGIIENLGTIQEVKKSSNSFELIIKLLDASKISLGDSIAVNGVCLTVENIDNQLISFKLSPETIRITSLESLTNNDIVNIELPLTLNKFINGHLTTGHIDSIGTIKSIKKNNDSWELCVVIDESILKYVVEKGSITIDGISLTVNEILYNEINVMIIPYTYNNTVIQNYILEQKVNIEVDYIAKHLDKLKK